MTTTSIFPTVDRPCPPWCKLPKGHGWDGAGADVGGVSRGHGSAQLAEGEHWSVNLYLLECAPATMNFENGIWDGEVVDAGASYFPGGALISLDEDGHGGPMLTATEARRAAAALLNAADRLDAAGK